MTKLKVRLLIVRVAPQKHLGLLVKVARLSEALKLASERRATQATATQILGCLVVLAVGAFSRRLESRRYELRSQNCD